MQTPQDMAAEAVHCRRSGNMYGFGQCLLELEAHHFTVAEIRQLLDEAEAELPSLDIENTEAPRDNAAIAEPTRDPRMPIPQSEWPRPRYGFAT